MPRDVDLKATKRLAKGQMGLLAALDKPRVSAADPYIGYRKKAKAPTNASQESNQEVEEDYDTVKLSASEREKRKEVLEVAALNHQSIPPPRTPSRNLLKQALARRERHEKAIWDYEARVREITDELEEKVLAVSREVQDGLESADEAIAKRFAQLRNDDYLVSIDIGDIEETWTGVDKLFQRRSQEVSTYVDRAEEVECGRLSRVGAETTRLVDTLVSIAFMLPNEVERLAETYTTELNQVLVSNRKASVELHAILLKLDVVERQKGKVALEERQRAWRRLKHELCLRTFHTDVSSDAYTNPLARQQTFSDNKALQLQRHEERMAVYGRLGKQTLPHIASTQVDAIATALEEVHAKECDANAHLLAQLEERKRECGAMGEGRREALRVDLHRYAHLAPEPDLKAHATALNEELFGSKSSGSAPPAAGLLSEIDGPEEGGEWAASGELKAELKAVIRDLADGRVIYAEVLAPLTTRLCTLLGAEAMDEACSKGGKLHLRKAIEDNVETLRKALKSETPPLWTALQGQLEELLALQDLDAHVRLALTGLLPSFPKAYDMSSAELDGSVGKSRAGRSKAPTPTARSPTARRGFFGETGPDMNMALVRSVQKRLACLLHVIHLSPKVRQRLHSALKDARTQGRCNQLVDEVVETECVGPLADRQAEQASLIARVSRSLNRHATYLQAVGQRLTSLYKALAIEVELDRRSNKEINEESVHAMRSRLEGFNSDDRGREAQVDARLDRVRHAADNKELETNFDAALQLLEEVERSYRVYHKEACATSLIHPLAVQAQNIKHRHAICEMLGLLSPMGEPDLPQDNSAIQPETGESHQGVEGESGVPTPEASGGTPLWKTNRLTEPSDTLSLSSRAAYPIILPLPSLAANVLATIPDPEDRQTPTNPDAAENAGGTPDAAAPITFTSSLQIPQPKGAKKGAPLVGLKWFRLPFLPLTEEDMVKLRAETPHLEEVYLDQRDAAFIELEGEELEGLDEKARGDYEAAFNAVDERMGEKERKQREEEERRAHERRLRCDTPRDKDENRCIERPPVPANEVLCMLTTLRDSLLLAAEDDTQVREAKALELCEARTDFLTEELEERLRMHWPRKGRTEVSYRDPREGELIAHRNKAERHVRTLADRNTLHETTFQKLLAEAMGRCDTFPRTMLGFQKALPSQTSLAAFQGLDMRAKKFMAQWAPQCAEDLTALNAYVTTEPSKLLGSNGELLRTCKLFVEGGDYDQKEVDLLKLKLERPTKAVDAAVEARRAKVKEVMAAQDKAWGATKVYREAYEAATLDLCLKEGLGQKYGAPRRSAQERLRTEVTRDERQHRQLEALVAMLETLCAPGGLATLQQKRPATADDDPERPTVGGPLAVGVRKTLLALRKCALKRGVYLEYLKAPLTLRAETAIPLDLEGEGERPGEVEVPDITTGTFTKALTHLEEECKASTKKLYEGDGKQAALGPDGIPDSLRAWLQERRDKALGPTGTRANSCDRFLGLVKRLESALGKTAAATAPDEPTNPGAEGTAAEEEEVTAEKKEKRPSQSQSIATRVALEDIMDRAKRDVEVARENEEAQFRLRLDKWEEGRETHRRALRPRLGTPDAASDLAALQASETQRGQEVQAAITAFRKSILANEALAAKQFVARLSAAVKSLSLLLDSLPATQDVGQCEVEEETGGKKKAPPPAKKPDKKAAAEVGDPFSDWSRNGWERVKWAPPPALEQLSSSMTTKGGVEAAALQAWVKESGDACTVYSFSTRAHEQLMSARSDVLHAYATYYADVCERLGRRYGALLEGEATWQGRWQGMVNGLLDSSRDIV